MNGLASRETIARLSSATSAAFLLGGPEDAAIGHTDRGQGPDDRRRAARDPRVQERRGTMPLVIDVTAVRPCLALVVLLAAAVPAAQPRQASPMSSIAERDVKLVLALPISSTTTSGRIW